MKHHLFLSTLALIPLLLATTAGCGKQAAQRSAQVSMESGHDAADVDQANGDNAGPKANKPPAGQPPQDPEMERKIIYEASLELFTEDLDKAQKKLTDLVEKYKGYLASSDIQGQVGTQRTGTWKIRIPVKAFNTFRQAVMKLGEPTRNSLSSKDVTSDYYDTQARIKNQKKLESRLLDHLEKSTKDYKFTLDIEKEVARVRSEIETLQGHLKMLQNLTSMTTVNVTIHERKDYQPEEVASFGTKVSRTFSSSIEGLTVFGQNTVLFLVAITPWLPVIVVVLIPIWWLLRRARKSKSGSTA